MKVYQKISNLINLINVDNNNDQSYIEVLDSIIKEYLPNGSGFNYEINSSESDSELLSFITSYATMDLKGYYGEVLDLEFIVTPDMQFGFNLDIIYLNYPELKEEYNDYFEDLWYECLDRDLDETSNVKVYQEISGKLKAIENCKKSGNDNWLEIHKEKLKVLIKRDLPLGSSFVYPVQCYYIGDKIMIKTKFRCLNEYGYYMASWPISVILIPSLQFGVKLELDYMGYDGKYKDISKDYFNNLWVEYLTKEIKGVN